MGRAIVLLRTKTVTVIGRNTVTLTTKPVLLYGPTHDQNGHGDATCKSYRHTYDQNGYLERKICTRLLIPMAKTVTDIRIYAY